MTETSASVYVGLRLAERYRLDRLLGQGGMGAVFEAFDLVLQRAVAVKLILPERAAHAESVARFLREARAAAALSHPGITTIHDVGQSPGPTGNTPYIVMERLRGETLADRLDRGPMALAEARSLGVALLDALSVAHDAGIVHRDIKPDNIFLREPGGTPTLVDFGIATILEGAGAGVNLTREGQSLGTPLYMAPEQLAGERVGPRADLYAVGAVLYEAVSGVPTFRQDTFAALVTAKLTSNPDPNLLLSAVGEGAFSRAVLAALARNPDDRPADARTLASMLGASTVDGFARTMVHDTGPRSVPAPGPIPAVAAESRANPIPSRGGRRAVAVGAIAIVGATAAIGLAFRRSSAPASVAPAAAPSGRVIAQGLREPAQALGILRSLREATGPERVLLESPEVWDQCAADFEVSIRHPAAPLRWRTGYELCRGYAHLLRAQAADALPMLERAAALDPSWPEAKLPLADALLALGRVDESIAMLRSALRLDPGWWLPSSKLGSVYARQENYPEAIQAYRRARAIAPRESRIVDALALTYHAAEMNDLAHETAAEAIALDPGAPWAHLIEAERALEANDGLRALESAERTLAVFPTAPAAVLARADALALLGRDDASRRAYEQLLTSIGDEEDEATGLPSGRLELVRAALAEGGLPSPRTEERQDATESSGRSAPSSVPSRPAPTRPTPMRSTPTGTGRSRPNDPLSGIDL